MADSDEEFDRRRARDKFRGERNEYERRDDRRGGGWEDRLPKEIMNTRAAYADQTTKGQGRREHWEQMAGGGGGRRERTYSDHHRGGYDRGRRERYPSPGRHEMSPPQMKRMRREWSDVDYPTQPPMMAFKHFLSQQEDSITDEEAIKRFNDYKLDFKKAQISEFFLAHKDEEWFKAKYHPEECGKRQEELKTALEKRAIVFAKLMAMGFVDHAPIDLDKCDDLIKLLDAAVILMEGGSEFDLRVLEIPTHNVNTNSKSNDNEMTDNDNEATEPEENSRNDEENETKKEEGEMEKDTEEAEEKEEKSKPEDSDADKPEPQEESTDPSEKEKKVEEEKDQSTKGKKRKRENSGSESGSDSGTDSDSGSDDEDSPKKGRNNKDQSLEEGEDAGEPGELGQGEDAKSERSKEEKARAAARFDNDEPRPRALHRTCSIFLRNLAPTITRQEVEAMCKRYPGFMRVALQDPQPERRFLRRGWVTFERTVNIKDICWNLNNIRLRECEMGAIVNRELKQRVRPVNGVTNYQQVIKADVKLAAKIVQNLDNKWGLWEEKEEKTDTSKDSISIGLQSKNLVLKNITDYLVEEGDYEEEELLGVNIKADDDKDGNAEVTIERDEELIKFIKVLDRMILYLRIVHSFDFYSAVEYPNEDEMPHRCGIIHARGPLPPVKMTQAEVNDYLNSFEQKVNGFINLKLVLEKEEAVKMGLKDSDAEVEKFVSANTQELGKDKWLCPLSGKKFKGPAFVQKHIFNKHVEKIEEVKKEVAFFNNFLLDPKRPSLPEHPGNRPGSSSAPPSNRSESGYSSQSGGGFSGGNQGGYSGGGYHRGGGQMGGGYQGRGGLRRNGGGGYQGSQGRGYDRGEQRRDRFQAPRQMRDGRRADPRSIIEYRDLDAPDDVDIF